MVPRPLPPWLLNPLRWASFSELAHLLSRPYGTVFRWNMTGTLADFGIRTYRDSHSRWWVEIPDSLLTPSGHDFRNQPPAS